MEHDKTGRGKIDPAFLNKISDNDARIWYLTNFPTEKNQDEPSIRIHIEYKYNIEQGKTTFSLDETIQYQIATMDIARLSGFRDPYVIRAVAKARAEGVFRRFSPLIWIIGVALLYVIVSLGYLEALKPLSNKLRVIEENYAESLALVSSPNQDAVKIATSMCKYKEKYIITLKSVERLLPWIEWSFRDNSAGSNNHISPTEEHTNSPCQTIRSLLQNEKIVPEFALTPKEASNDSNAYTDALNEYYINTVNIRRSALKIEITNGISRQIVVNLDYTIRLLEAMVLPVLLAVLGALFSVFHRLNRDFDSARLLGNVHIYTAACLLGIFSGISASALFTSVQGLAEGFGLTKLGIAFLFGYSADIFLKLLDQAKEKLTRIL